jgi:hypothetical protein
MTIPELIERVLGAIRSQFYADRPREFLRDERALTKALCRYGHECHQRGWDFAAEDIRADLMKLLNEIKRTGAKIGYLPVYLEGAVTRHIGQRAEELSALAKSRSAVLPTAKRLVNSMNVVTAVVEATNTHMLAAFYQHQKQVQRAKRAKARAKEKQEVLL